MIDVQNLSKSSDNTTIINDLTFQLEPGDRLGLLGANGSGKSVLIKILATLIPPTSGTVMLVGYDAFANPHTVRPQIGYVPQVFEGYSNLSVREYLAYFAAVYKLEKSQRSPAISDALDLMELINLGGRKMGTLSAGEKQRVCLAKTFLHDPAIWLLDEPFSTLDPRGQLEMRALIEELGAMGKTVVWATNRPADIMDTCNRVGILAEGDFKFFGEPPDTHLEELFFEVTTPSVVNDENDE